MSPEMFLLLGGVLLFVLCAMSWFLTKTDLEQSDGKEEDDNHLGDM